MSWESILKAREPTQRVKKVIDEVTMGKGFLTVREILGLLNESGKLSLKPQAGQMPSAQGLLKYLKSDEFKYQPGLRGEKSVFKNTKELPRPPRKPRRSRAKTGPLDYNKVSEDKLSLRRFRRIKRAYNTMKPAKDSLSKEEFIETCYELYKKFGGIMNKVDAIAAIKFLYEF